MSKINIEFGEDIFTKPSGISVDISTRQIYDSVIKSNISLDINNIITQKDDGLYAKIDTPDDILSFINKLDNIVI